MRVGNLQSGAGQLQDALEKLLIAWEQTREVWDDARAKQFEETYLRPISEEVSMAVPAVGHMSQTMGTAVRECEE